MAQIDNILKRLGLKYSELNSAEKETLRDMTKTLESNQLSVKAVYGFIKSLRVAVESELDTYRKETPQSFLSLLALFIPFYGIVKKWYQDEHKVYLEARLNNLLLIEAFLIGPKRAKEAVERALGNLQKSKEDTKK